MPVAQMTFAEAITAVRSATAHDVDQQVTDTQLAAELDREYRRVRRRIAMFAPSMYQVVLDNIAVPMTAIPPIPSNAIAKPDNFERVLTLERQLGNQIYAPLSMMSQLNAQGGRLQNVSGVYRLTYIRRPIDQDLSTPAALAAATFDIPEGAEDIITQTVCGWVRQRHNEDPTWHMERAQMLFDELRSNFVMRYGMHPRSLLQTAPSCFMYLTFFEQGSNLIIF
jgi:hypothetical protein